VTKSEWGTKRNCLGCGVAFYDLRKSPIICPKCGEKHDPQPLLKPRRTGPQLKPGSALKKVAPIETEEPDADINSEKARVGLEIDDEDEVDKNLLEDASELVGTDDEDEGVNEVNEVKEVKENLEVLDDDKA